MADVRYETARELTSKVIEKLVVRNQGTETNKKFAEEVAEVYKVIFDAVDQKKFS